MNSKERCMAVLKGETPDRTPVFPLMMFFPAHRAKLAYRQYATDASALVDAQLNLFERYGVDAVTVCSDAFRVSADMGAVMSFPENQTPHGDPFVRVREDLLALRRPDPMKPGSRMRDRVRAVEGLASAVGNKALVLGWVEMPFAEACDWCGVSDFMMILLDEPELAHEILEFIAQIEIDFALAQLAAGAHMIGCGDAAASLISSELFAEFALPYEKRVNEAIHNAGGLSKLHICGNTTHLLPQLVINGSDLYNVDHLVDLTKACAAYGEAGKAFKGNVNPVADIMQATSAQAEAAALSCIREAKGLRYLLSAGCEIPAGTSDESYFGFANAPNKV